MDTKTYKEKNNSHLRQWARSLARLSVRLLTEWSGVQIPPGPPLISKMSKNMEAR